MVDHLEPNTYLAVGADTDAAEYRINHKFEMPFEITKHCCVKGVQAYIAIYINLGCPLDPSMTMVIIFDVNKLSPHEVFLHVSQQYDAKLMKKDDWAYVINEETLKCIPFFRCNCISRVQCHRVHVHFNPEKLDLHLCN